jgi:para-nitrobenzyl esterase
MDIGPTNEDCLFLNVWTPAVDTTRSAPARLHPVMFWIHGGGFVFGSGNYPNYAPTADQALAMDAVLVSINYRLGPLGWLATSELSLDNAENMTSGNYGLMDMIAALRWVQRNIYGFGGDAAAVTLYGQSAGGTATMALMAAPAARGLFHRALMQSGSARFNTTMREAELDNTYFIKSAGCGGRASAAAGVACLRAASTATLIEAIRWDAYPGWGGGGVSGFPVLNFSWGNLAIVDGTVLLSSPVDAIASGDPRRASIVPLVIGSTAQETDLFPIRDTRNMPEQAYDALARRAMAPFGAAVVNATLALYPRALGDAELRYTSLSSDIGVNCPNSAFARAIGTSEAWRAHGQPLYRYVLTAFPSEAMTMLGSAYPGRYAFHTLDTVYLFNTTRGALAGRALPTAADRALTRSLRADMGAFVRDGTIGAWTQYPSTMEIGAYGAVSHLGGDYRAEACAFWESHGFFNYSWAGN